MIIADRLRTTNRAEYILYMWQVEDILRAYRLDMDEVREHYLPKFQVAPEERAKMEEWYGNLCRMMSEEGLKDGGHLQINKNALASLEELHRRLLASEKFPYYREMYYKVLPYIVELRAKNASPSGAQDASGTSEIETCFIARYGVLLLCMQGKAVTEQTLKATRDISTLLGQLSDYYLKDQQEPLEL
ncbi:MAG: DUF4924 family protein [Alloprevotella sp.]|nr:DUF4924 family protein [Alloprevotella sp.]